MVNAIVKIGERTNIRPQKEGVGISYMYTNGIKLSFFFYGVVIFYQTVFFAKLFIAH